MRSNRWLGGISPTLLHASQDGAMHRVGVDVLLVAG